MRSWSATIKSKHCKYPYQEFPRTVSRRLHSDWFSSLQPNTSFLLPFVIYRISMILIDVLFIYWLRHSVVPAVCFTLDLFAGKETTYSSIQSAGGDSRVYNCLYVVQIYITPTSYTLATHAWEKEPRSTTQPNRCWRALPAPLQTAITRSLPSSLRIRKCSQSYG